MMRRRLRRSLSRKKEIRTMPRPRRSILQVPGVESGLDPRPQVRLIGLRQLDQLQCRLLFRSQGRAHQTNQQTRISPHRPPYYTGRVNRLEECSTIRAKPYSVLCVALKGRGFHPRRKIRHNQSALAARFRVVRDLPFRKLLSCRE